MRKLWKEVKSWFKYSETIAFARFDVLLGFAIAALASMDWSPLLSLDFSEDFKSGQLYFIGALCVVHGIIAELLRRRNATFHTEDKDD